MNEIPGSWYSSVTLAMYAWLSQLTSHRHPLASRLNSYLPKQQLDNVWHTTCPNSCLSWNLKTFGTYILIKTAELVIVNSPKLFVLPLLVTADAGKHRCL